ncbi:iduronate 2-sulfatase-like [Corticium candelabrum]|uniref:iduronate 2-sulfatase-like n=1 Tax=Corticium candelabrum TaxID=121492 RepID=UPI002E3098D9|nr:iduronate 2-sulfatase-like [Corticium candelabrum]
MTVPTVCGAAKLKNVLYFVIDDLRPQLGAYDQHETYTPNIDKLAKQALVFERAYCQQSVCAPSRNSFMTGRRPDTSKVWNFIDHFREKGVGLNWSSMPQYFKEHGYFSSGVGKVFHKNLPPNFDPPSWSDLSQFPWYYGDPGHCPKNTSWCALPRDHPFCDVNSTSIIIERLRYVAQNNSGPFFLAVGFHKPHLPWAFPEEFIKQYPNQSAISVAKFLYIPTGMPYIAFYNGMRPHKYSDLHRYTHNITTPYPVTVQQQLRRGYYAATTYMDSLVGKVLDELDRLGLSNDTIVALHGDHGYQLGEHNEWAKHTNFELATRVPFMIRVPWQPDTAGKKTSALVELVDVFPTLVELAGLPPCQENLDGLSLVPLFHNQTKTVKAAALSQYPRCGDYKNGNADVCLHTNRSQFNYMGYSMRTDRYRYTEWVKWNGTKLEGDWHGLVARELYDHQGDDGNDFNAFENENIAESQPEIVKELSLKLRNIFSKH